MTTRKWRGVLVGMLVGGLLSTVLTPVAQASSSRSSAAASAARSSSSPKGPSPVKPPSTTSTTSPRRTKPPAAPKKNPKPAILPAPKFPTHSGDHQEGVVTPPAPAPNELRPGKIYVPVPGKLSVDAHHKIVDPEKIAKPATTVTPAGHLPATGRLRDVETAAAAATAPDPPTGVSTLARDRAVTVSWTAPATNGGSAITSYTVTSNPGSRTATATAGTSAEVFGLTDGTAYTFTVTATNAAGTSVASAASAAVTPVAATAPGSATNVVATPGNAQVTVTWAMPANDGGADLTDTYVTIVKVSDNSSSYVDVPAPATTATIGKLVDGAAYYVQVLVYNRDYYSGATVQSAQFTPVAGPQPAPPASVTATAGTAQASVAWTTPSSDGGSPITGYTVTAYDSNNNQVGTPLTVAASSLTAVVTGLTNGTAYYFAVAATNAAGTGPAWYSTTVTPAGPPSAPTGVTGYAANKSVFVNWTAPSDTGGSPITSYTVTASGPGGFTATEKVTSQSAIFSGLANGGSYTFTVVGANAVAAGTTSAASAASSPTENSTRPVGNPHVDPQPTAPVNTQYVEQRYMPTISGDGRYIFYFGQLDSTNVPNPSVTDYTGVSYGWSRYDVETGTTLPIWQYSGGGGYSISDTSRWSATDYTGDVFASFAGGSLYVWREDTGQTVLASANAAGSATAGVVDEPSFSGDGSYLFFNVHDDADMAGSSYCNDGNNTNVSAGPKVNVGMYRFDTTTGKQSRIPMALSEPGLAITCVEPAQTFPTSVGTGTSFGAGYPDSVAHDGERILALVDIGYTQAGSTTVHAAASELATIDIATDGSTTTTWLTPLYQSSSYATWDTTNPPQISEDGNTVVGQISQVVGSGYHESLVTVDPAAPAANPVAFADADPISPYGEWNLSRDGSSVSAVIGLGIGPIDPQTVVIKTRSGAVSVASQVNGAVALPSSSTLGMAADIDGAGRRVVMETNAPNLLGRTDCATSTDFWGNAACPSNLVVVDMASGTVGVLPDQALGCDCGSSLGQTGPLQNFVGDPVNTATGSYTEPVEDVKVAGSGVPFDFKRTYNSAAASVSGPLGPGWSVPYAMALSIATNGDATVTDESGGRATFAKQSNGSFTAPPGVNSSLAASGSGYALTLTTSQVDSFDASGRLTSMKDDAGRGLTFAYSGSQMTSVTTAEGRTVAFGYNAANGLLASLGLPDGTSVEYGYDSGNRLQTVTDPAGLATTYGYDTANRLTTVTGPGGHLLVQNTYDPATGRVTAQAQPGGADPQIAWDPVGEVATSTDSKGATTRDYYSGNVLVAHVDADGGVTSYRYDGHLNLVASTDPDGHTTTMTYDGAGDMLTRTSPAPLSYTESWTWDTHHDMLSHTDGLGHQSKYTYDTSNRLLTSTDPAGGETKYTYDPNGQVSTITDPMGKLTQNTYDTAGNLSSQTDPTGAKTTYQYDANGRLLRLVDPLGNAANADPTKHTTSYTYNGDGQVLTITDPDGHVRTDKYDAVGNLWTETDPAGKITTYGYDNFNRRTSVLDANNHTSSVQYDSRGLVISVTDADNNSTSYTYDPAGRLTGTTTPRGTADNGAQAKAYTTTYTYDAAGDKLTTTDPLNNVTSTYYNVLNRPVLTVDARGGATALVYDAAGNLVSTTDPDGYVSTRTYDPDNRPLTSSDGTKATTTKTYDLDGRVKTSQSPMQETTSYTYDDDGRTKTIVDPRGNAANANPAAYTTTYNYDLDGNPQSVVDALGHTSSTQYDAAGLLSSATDAAGKTTGYGYDLDGRQTTATDPDNHTVTTNYDAVGNVSSVVDTLGDKTSYTYDNANLKVSATSPRGNVAGATPAVTAAYTTGYGYDSDGHQTTVTEPGGAATTSVFDADGRVTTSTNALQHATRNTYDADGNLLTVTDPANGVVTNTFDPDNRLATSQNQDGKTTTFTHDGDGRMLTQVSPKSETSSRTYDLDGRTSTSTDARGNVTGAKPADYTTAYGYDAAGNQTGVTDPYQHTTGTVFDADNRMVSKTDPLNDQTQYTYDNDGRLLQILDPAGAKTGYTYDDAGNLKTRTDADTHVTQYAYTDADQLHTVTDPLNRVTTYDYDPDGNRTSTVDARNITTTVTIDPRELTTGIAYSDGTPSVTYGYDATGTRVTIADGTGTRTVAHDDAGRITGVTGAVGGSGFAYGYDPAGLITSRTYPDGEKTTYTYDNDGNMQTQVADGATVTYGYDAARNLTSTALPAGNGYTESRQYDQAGRLASIATAKSGSTLASWQYSYNSAGRPTELDSVRAGQAQPPQYFGYDLDGRLTSWCTSTAGTTNCPAGSSQVGYTYDPVGNRTTTTKAGRTTGYTYDAADELLSASAGLIRQSFTHDAAGNMTGNGSSVNTITYDATNHPIAATQGTSKDTFVNDDAGNRVATSVNGTLARTDVWDVNNPLPQLATETGAGGALIGDYHADPLGLPQSEHTTAGAFYDSHDALGSVTDLTDSTGADQYQNSYDPYGIETTAGTSATAPHQMYGFGGQLLDEALAGKQDLRAREYDPTTGRFTSNDPIQLRIDDPYVAAYVYGEDAPTYHTDPSGAASNSAPGDGRWTPPRGKSTAQHNFVLLMAYQQEIAIHGADKVYADFDGGMGMNGGKEFTYKTGWADEGKPDLVALGVQTPKGLGAAIWDVKPASEYGRSKSRSINKLAGYIKGFTDVSGLPAMAGDPVTPEARPYAEPGAYGIMVMFNGMDWQRFRIPDVQNLKVPADTAKLADTKGIIYYKLDEFGMKTKTSDYTKALNKFKEEGAAASLTICRPFIPAFGPLQNIGHLSSSVQVDAVASGVRIGAPYQLNVVSTSPFHAPVVQRYTGSGGADYYGDASSSHSGGGGDDGMDWTAFGFGVAAGLTILQPEIGIPLDIAEGGGELISLGGDVVKELVGV